MRMTIGGRRDATSVGEDELAKKRQELRDARLKAARNQPNWTEITPAERLIPRGPARFGWLCDAADDRLWCVERGNVFLPSSANIFATHSLVTYYVDANGDVIALEPAPFPTWSAVIKQRPELVEMPAT